MHHLNSDNFQEARGIKDPEPVIQNPRKIIINEGPK